jgi:hypothetical protein
MANDADKKDEFLLTEYEFMEKAYELQFNHFMGVFYFWIVVVGAPISAGILTTLGLEGSQKFTALGILCIFVSLLGVFLSAKMFDIRHSQLRYVKKLNEIRDHFWQTYKIEETNKLVHLGKNADLAKTAKTDFGTHMAWIMSLIHVSLVCFGSWFILLHLSDSVLMLLLSILFGVIMWVLNFRLYFRIVVNKLKR